MENEELLRVLDEQRVRSDDLGRTLQEAQLEQQALFKYPLPSRHHRAIGIFLLWGPMVLQGHCF